MSNAPAELTHFIGGRHVKGTSGRFGDVFQPMDGSLRARVPLANKAEVAAAVENAKAAQPAWAATNPQRRARVLMKFLELANRDYDRLADCLAREHGKTIADAKGDIQRGLEVVEFACGIPHLMKGEYTEGAGPGIDLYSMRQALGVVAGITPFNFPAMIPLWKCAPAIACGNAFILKPSERDPGVPLMLAELFVEAGLPAGILNVVNGDKEAVDAILEHPDIQAIGFVGSTPIAAYIYAQGCAAGKRVQCFGGAKNHMIVMPDADMDQAVDALVGRRLRLGRRALHGGVGGRARRPDDGGSPGGAADPARGEPEDRPFHIKRCRLRSVGDGCAPEEGEGLRGAGHRGRRQASGGRPRLQDAGLRGRLLHGRLPVRRGEAHDADLQEEIFGPVLSVVRAKTYEEGLRLASDHEYGNGVAIFTRDGDAARDFAARVNTGMVGINVPIPVPLAYHTFGGWKRSAFGDLNQHGPDSVRFYTRTKTVTSRWPSGVKEGAEFVIPTMK